MVARVKDTELSELYWDLIKTHQKLTTMLGDGAFEIENSLNPQMAPKVVSSRIKNNLLNKLREAITEYVNIVYVPNEVD